MEGKTSSHANNLLISEPSAQVKLQNTSSNRLEDMSQFIIIALILTLVSISSGRKMKE